MEKNLTNLNEGDYGYISQVTVTGKMRQRLHDLGLTEGAKVCCVHKSPHGDPVAYIIRGAVIALRNDDARCVTLSRGD